MARQWHRDRFIPHESCERVQCTECDVNYWLPKSKVGKYPTCGGECTKIRRARLISERNRACAVCKKIFTPRNTQLVAGHGVYCSHACQGIAQSGDGNQMYGKVITLEQKAKWRATRDKNNSWLFGEKNPNWVGGWRIRYERYKASGGMREANMRRRSKAVHIPKGTIKKLLRLQKNRCAICGINVGNKYHVDHIMPLALGGDNSPGNLQIACPRCNLKKNAKHPIDYMQSIGKLL